MITRGRKRRRATFTQEDEDYCPPDPSQQITAEKKAASPEEITSKTPPVDTKWLDSLGCPDEAAKDAAALRLPETIYLVSCAPKLPSIDDPIAMANILLERVKPVWRTHLESILLTPRGIEILTKYRQSLNRSAVFPPMHLIFRAFELFDFADTRVVILGQDPYFQPGQAMGLSFSVPRGAKIPPTLKVIFKELGIPTCDSGDLTPWAQQGVLLLNTVLTVQKGKAASHARLGWTFITDYIVELVGTTHPSFVVFLLWGAHAQKRRPLVNEDMHSVLISPHPSPQTQGFLGCQHFQLCNSCLEAHGRTGIDWLAIAQGASGTHKPPSDLLASPAFDPCRNPN